MCTLFGLEEADFYDEVDAKDLAPRLRAVDECDRVFMTNERDESLTLRPLERQLHHDDDHHHLKEADLCDEEMLWTAAEDGDLSTVLQCIASGVDLNAFDESDKYTAVLVAAEAGHAKVVESLHAAGALVDCRDAFGRTPLYAASVAGHKHIVSYLLEKASADVDAADEDGRTPFWSSCATRQLDTATILLAHGANIDARDNIANSAMAFASQNGHADVIHFLQKRGAARPRSRLHSADDTPKVQIPERMTPDSPHSDTAERRSSISQKIRKSFSHSAGWSSRIRKSMSSRGGGGGPARR